MLVCGHSTMSWDDFRQLLMSEPPEYKRKIRKAPTTAETMDWYDRTLRAAQNSVSEPHPLQQIDLIRAVYRNEGEGGGLQNSMLQLCDSFRRTRCSDPRDKAYALRFIARTEIQPDYTKPVNHLFLDICADSLLLLSPHPHPTSMQEQVDAVQGTAVSLGLARDEHSTSWLEMSQAICKEHFYENYSCSRALADSLTKLVGMLLHVAVFDKLARHDPTHQKASARDLAQQLQKLKEYNPEWRRTPT